MGMNQLLRWVCSFGGSEFDSLLQVKILQCTHAENEKNYIMKAMPYKFSDFFSHPGCIVRKYSAKTMNKFWPDIWRAMNQKCNDLSKKQTQWLSLVLSTVFPQISTQWF